MTALHVLAQAAAAVPSGAGEWVAPGGILAGLIAAAGLVAREVRMIRADGYADMRRQRDAARVAEQAAREDAEQEKQEAREAADARLAQLERTVGDLRTEVEGLREDQGRRDDAHRVEMRAQEDRHRAEMRDAETRHRAEVAARQDELLHVTQRNFLLAEHLARHGMPLPPETEETPHG